MRYFAATIEIIGINPFVFVPQDVLEDLFKIAEKEKGPIPIKGLLNGKPYRQTLVKYRGHWRLYINTTMLRDSPKRIGEIIRLNILFDPEDRSEKPHPEFLKAFRKNSLVKKAYNQLIPSRKKEILRYLNQLKTESSLQRNIEKVVLHLTGKAKFAGRE